MSSTDSEFQQRMQRVEGLLLRIERFTDPEAQATTRELVQSLMDLHSAGLATMLELTAEAGGPGRGLIDRFARDGLVGSLLLLYGLHPLDIETRVRGALDKVRPYLHSHKGDVELLGIAEGVVRLRMQGSCDGCPSSAMTLKLSIEEAIFSAAPDVISLEVEGVPVDVPPANGLFSLPLVDSGRAHS